MPEKNNPNTILIVDDSPATLKILTEMIVSGGLKYEPITANNGNEALEKYHKHRPDIALIDWMIPGLDGIDLIKEIRRHEKKNNGSCCYIIMVTVRYRTEDIVSCLEQGADDYLVKPFERRILLGRIHAGSRVIEHQKELSLLNKKLKKQVEEHRKSRKVLLNYKLMADASKDYISLVDGRYTYQAVNETYLKARKLDEGDIVGKKLCEVWGEKVFQNILKTNIDKALSGELVHYESLFGFVPSGSRYMDVTFYPYAEKGNKISHVVITSHDITSVKRAEEDLRKLFCAVEHSPHAIAIADIFGNIKYINPRFLERIHDEYTVAIGTSWQTAIVGENEQLYREIWSRLAKGEEWKGEVTRKDRRHGLVWEHLTTSPIKNESGEITDYLAIIEDITDRVTAEQAKDEMHHQLIQSAKLATLGELSAGIAHELNNILTTIMGYAEELELLANDGELDRNQAKLISGNIIGVSERMTKIIKQMKKSSRGALPEFVPYDIHQIIEDSLFLLQKKLKSNAIELNTAFDHDLPQIHCDPGQIEQVIINILTNAISALEDARDQKIVITTRRSDNAEIRIDIWNNGPDIPGEIIEKIFDPFFTTKSLDVGTGLGLSIVKTIMKNHGGSIAVRSMNGTCFSLTFPETSSTVYRRRKRILVVDFNSEDRENISRKIKGFGYNVIAERSLEAGLALLESDDIFAIFIDPMVLDRSRLLFSEDHIRHLKAVPIIFLVTETSSMAAEECGYQPFALLKKPLNNIAIKKVIKSLEKKGEKQLATGQVQE